MKVKLIIVLFLQIVVNNAVAQKESSFNGIIIKPSSANCNSFYYGEPFRIYFEIINTKNVIKHYWILQTGVNYKLLLKNLNTGKIISPIKDFWTTFSDQRDKWKSSVPPDKLSFQPNEYSTFSPLIFKFFGREKLSNKKFPSYNNLIEKLNAIPVGKYELIFKYYLLPSDKVLTSTYQFEILPVPQNEKAAFKNYVAATTYAAESHFWGNKNYSANHPYSYDNFIREFPNSIYSEYAFIDMVFQMYSYPSSLTTEEQRKTKYQEFVKYYPKLTKSNIKLDYFAILPRYYKIIYEKKASNEIDKFLLKIKDENADFSKLIIRVAALRYNIKGLKNYSEVKYEK